MDTIVALADPYGTANAFTGDRNLWNQWLGPLPNTGRTDPYEARAVDKWNMPDAYVGQNQFLGQTVLDLLFLNNNYMVKRIMPLRETNQITLQWEQFEAMAHMLDTTPYQTPAHLLTQRRSIRRARLVHRNIMAEFEQNFLMTPMGRVSFMAAMRQIENSVIQTAVAEGVRSLLNCHRYQEQFRREHMPISVLDIQDALKRDRENFAIVQKVKNGMTKLDLDITKTMTSYGGVADAYLVPEEVSIFCTSVPSTATDYDKAGPLGPARINGTGPNNPGAAGTDKHAEPTYFVRNNDTYIVKDLRVEGVSREDAEMLTRVRQIGEYMVMAYNAQMDDYTKYRTKHRSILVYDEDIDDMREITLQDAINNCGLWDENGNLRPVEYNNPRVSGLERQQDMFVHFRGNDRTPYVTDYLFQMSPAYLSADVLVNAAKTMGNRAVAGIVGPDNFLGIDIGALNFDSIPPQDLAADEGLRGQRREDVPPRPVPVRPVPAPENPNLMNERIRLDSAFLKMMVAAGPASKQVELNAIAAQENVPAVARSEQIRDRIGQYITEKVKGVRFPDVEKVQDWHKVQLNKYQEQVAAVQAPVQVQALATSILPTNIEDIPVFARLFNPQQRQQPQDGGHLQESSGVGLAEIGQFAWASGSNADVLQDNLDARFPARAGARGNIQRHWDAIRNASGDANVQRNALSLLMMKITRPNLLRLAKADVVVPLNFLLMRPHQQYATKTVIKCKQDGGTGYTFIGMAHFQIEHEAGRMMALAHYSTHMRSVVMQPKNAYVQPDVLVVRCEGGAGCRFWTPDTYKHNRNPDEERILTSLIAVAVPATENDFPSPLDITGRFNTLYSNQVSGRNVYEPLHYSTAARYNELYEFSKTPGTDNAEITGQRSHNNTVCYQGHQQNFNPVSGKFDFIIVNKGHWGKNVYPGVRDEVRAGGRHELKNMDYTTSATNAYYSQ